MNSPHSNIKHPTPYISGHPHLVRATHAMRRRTCHAKVPSIRITWMASFRIPGLKSCKQKNHQVIHPIGKITPDATPRSSCISTWPVPNIPSTLQTPALPEQDELEPPSNASLPQEKIQKVQRSTLDRTDHVTSDGVACTPPEGVPERPFFMF